MTDLNSRYKRWLSPQKSQHQISNTPGSISIRSSAYMIDSILYLISILAVEYFYDSYIDEICFVLWAFQFVILPAMTGQTLGKKILSLRVVNATSGESPSTLLMILRETIGKVIIPIALVGTSMAILLPIQPIIAGLMVLVPLSLQFITKRNRFLHDYLANTVVIQNQTSTLSLGTRIFNLILCIALPFLTSGAFIYFLLFSSLPVQQVAKQLARFGVEFSSVDGNLMSGISARNIRYSNANFEATIDEVSVSYQNLVGMIYSNAVSIDDIFISNIRIVIKNLNSKQIERPTLPNQLSPISVMALYQGVAVLYQKFWSSLQLGISHIEVNDAKFVVPGFSEAGFQKLAGTNFFFDGKRLQFERATFVNELIDLSIAQLEWSKEKIFLGRPLKLTLKSKGAEDLLKTNIDMKIMGEYHFEKQGLTPSRGTLLASAFQNQVQIELRDQNVQIQINELIFEKYFLPSVPIKSLDWHAYGEVGNLFQTGLTSKGFLHWNEYKFAMASLQSLTAPIDAYFQRGRQIFRLRFDLMQTLMMKPGTPTKAMPKKALPLEMVLVGEDRPREVLASLYYSRNFDSLNPEEMKVIAADLKFLTEPSPTSDAHLLQRSPTSTQGSSSPQNKQQNTHSF